jgi:cell division protein FtsX
MALRKKSGLIRLVFSVVCSMLIILSGLLAYFYAESRVNSHASSINLALFLAPETERKVIDDITSDLYKLSPAVDQVKVKTPDSLSSFFSEKFGVNVGEVLPNNPFPIVLYIYFKPNQLSWSTFSAFIEQCRQIEEVENTSYRSEYVKAVFEERTTLVWSSIAGAVFVFVVIFMLLYFTIRSESAFTNDDVTLLQLLGGKKRSLRIASLARGFAGGILGILIGAGVGFTGLLTLGSGITQTITQPTWLLVTVSAVIVMILVLVISYMSLPTRKFQ